MMQLFCQPFVAGHLRHALTVMADLADTLDDQLKCQLGAHRCFGETTEGSQPVARGDESGSDLPAELLTILQLDPDSNAAVTPEQAAKI
jgi:hypothetical protein